MSILEEFDNYKKLEKIAEELKKSPLYQHYSYKDILGILVFAQDRGISLAQALDGGLYIFNGKIEMTSRLMHMLIRSRGHGIKIDPKSDAEKCILHGRRADNGNELTVCFSKDNIKNPKLLNKPNWRDYTDSMLFARALSLLARRLFADVIGGAYVEGELEDAISEEEKVINIKNMFREEQKTVSPTITPEQLNIFEDLLKKIPEYIPHVEGYLKQNNIKDFSSIPVDIYERFILKMRTFLQKKEEKTLDLIKIQEKEQKEANNLQTSTTQEKEVVNG